MFFLFLLDSFWACTIPNAATTMIKAVSPDTTIFFILLPPYVVGSDFHFGRPSGHLYTLWSAKCGKEFLSTCLYLHMGLFSRHVGEAALRSMGEPCKLGCKSPY